jgi:hypothetical protein
MVLSSPFESMALPVCGEANGEKRRLVAVSSRREE